LERNFWQATIAISIVACAEVGSQTLARAPDKVDDGWDVAAPEQVDADPQPLEEMLRQIEDGDFPNIHSVLVVKDGLLVLESYFDGHDRDTPHEIRSATKSVGSILTGIAIDQGFLPSENVPIHSYFKDDYEPAAGWTERARTVRIRDFLSMMSGYDCDDIATDFACEDEMYGTDDWVQYSLDLPFAYPPGEHWAYNSSSLILVGEAVARASGMTLEEFADVYLFEPLGIERFEWAYSPNGRAWMGGGAEMIPREMAKIGKLMVDGGVWNGERVLSEAWIERSTTKQGEYRAGVDYGFLWQRGETFVGSEKVTAYWASGNGGQLIFVFPDRDLVAVFTAGNYNDPLAGQAFGMLGNFILPAFLRPTPFEEVEVSQAEMEVLGGYYELDFERNVTSSVDVHQGQLRILTPDGEYVELVAHSAMLYSGDSQYGPLTVVFEADETGKIVRHKVYGALGRFVFEKR
jgi:CubicO group peptidase (beta-lactamase class C family)